MDNQKKIAALKAAEYVQTGMVIGLGTGSTVKFFVDEVGRRIREDGLLIKGVTTSSTTSAQAESLGIPMLSLDEAAAIDLLVDGADEIDQQLNGIKGGGGALLLEKIAATYAKAYMWIVDESKLSEKLGSFKLPVEVVPFGSQKLFEKFEAAGYQPTWRETTAGARLITDMKHEIIDLHFEVIENPKQLAAELDATVGVVEHGLFLDMVQTVIVGGSDGVRIMKR